MFDATIADSGNFDANQLYKTITKDENWTTGNNNTTQEFKNKEGQVVLKRTFNNGIAHDTYYVYDNRGNLTYVIPPLANGSILQADLDGLCYQYKYDYRNRLVEKKLPGKQWEFIIYDKLDRVVATGPALSPFSNLTGNGWLVTKYDAFNRPVLTAWLPAIVTSATRKTQQDAITAATVLNETKTATATNTTINSVAFRYSNVAWPTASYHVLTVNYYDDYNFPNAPTIPTTIETQPVYYNTTIKPRGLATATWVRALETSALVKAEESYTLYDKKSRPIRSYTKNHLGGFTQVDSKLDFIGKTEYTLTTHKRLAADAVLTVKDMFTYSAQDRLVLHKQQINTLPEQLITKNTYDELGQLVSKNVGGTDITGALGLQKVDYAYNIRGWLKGINDIDNLTQGSNPVDLFAFKLSYEDPLLNGRPFAEGKALYNGNISQIYWRTSNDNVLRKYDYFYDNLNRLTNASYMKAGTAVTSNSYGEAMSYDKNGNITKLTRYGGIDADGTSSLPLKIDQLVYTYDPKFKNQLIKVLDEAKSPQGFDETKDLGSNGINDTTIDYTYDTNPVTTLEGYGNLKTDENKGITAIVYNHMNLPLKITFGTTGNIEYIYNAAGQKLQKKVTQGSTITTTLYMGNFQYLNNVLQFFGHAEGYVKNTSGVYSYVYNYTDHLGNVRLSYTKNTTTNVLTILEENHYYPYGLKHLGYNTTNGQPDYKYKINSREFQGELSLNVYDMDMRQLDPALGRWMVQDPVVHHDLSPYNAFDNNPVFWADPSGGDSESDYFFNHDGQGRNRYDRFGMYITPDARGINSNQMEMIVGNDGHMTMGLGGSWRLETSFTVTGKMVNGVMDMNFDIFTFHTWVQNEQSVGQPGTWESIIPIWGSGRAAVDHFQNGNYWTGAFYTAMAISDVFLVKSIVTGLAKGGLKLIGSSSWSATRQYYLKKGFAIPNQPLHHWLLQQRGPIGKYFPNVIKNQMWNLMPLKSAAFHTSIHGKGINAFNVIERAYYGSPVWFKAGITSTIGHATLLEE